MKSAAATVMAAWVLVWACAGCGKAKPPARQVDAGKPARGAVASTREPAADLPTTASPTSPPAGLPAGATQTGQPPSGSVGVAIDSGQPGGSGLPSTTALTTLTVTPLTAKGQPATARGKVLDAELVLVATRYDLSWMQVLRAVQLSDSAHHSHAFRVQFSQPGSHKLHFIWQPLATPGQPPPPPAVTTVTVQVQGEAAPGQAWADDQRHFRGPDGTEAELSWEGGSLQPCRPLRVTTLWKGPAAKRPDAKSKAADAADSFLYLAVSQSGGDAEVGLPVPATASDTASATAPSALGGDSGADALLSFGQTGVHRILAIRQRRGRTATAQFGVRVEGQVAAGGCPR